MKNLIKSFNATKRGFLFRMSGPSLGYIKAWLKVRQSEYDEEMKAIEEAAKIVEQMAKDMERSSEHATRNYQDISTRLIFETAKYKLPPNWMTCCEQRGVNHHFIIIIKTDQTGIPRYKVIHSGLDGHELADLHFKIGTKHRSMLKQFGTIDLKSPAER